MGSPFVKVSKLRHLEIETELTRLSYVLITNLVC